MRNWSWNGLIDYHIPLLEKKTREYIKSRGFVHGGSVCKGGGKAIRGLGFKGVK